MATLLRSADEIGEVALLLLGKAELLLAQGDGLHQEHHVPGQDTHGLESLGILGSVTGDQAMDTVPVLAGDHRHTADGEILVQLVEGAGAAAAAGDHHTGAHFHGLVEMAAEEQAAQDGHEGAVDASVVHGSTHHHAVGFLQLPGDLIDDIIDRALAQLAAGAAVAGCCANMIGFAIASYRDNKCGGLISQGVGTSMLQMPNIVRKPIIWLPAIIASAITGPISAAVLGMISTPTGSGMGTAGLVVPIETYFAMTAAGTSAGIALIEIAAVHFVLPGLIALGVCEGMRKLGWIKNGDMKLR